ncbi:MAG: PEP-CTERM sorting domain-containing protein [Phycisphaeraceae bacterium]|nr:PEP-CTERM sorting domain-containing protein [Phycisphaeraceae bacterium]
MKRYTLSALLACGLTGAASATVVFSNNFEDGNFTPEVGSWTIANTATTTVLTGGGGDATLGNNAGLIDGSGSTPPVAGTMDVDIDFTDLDLTGGKTATVSWDSYARRTNGTAKELTITGYDSSGNEVFAMVLGDANSFGNGGGDRQRPGFATSSGKSTLPGPGTPGSFWFGANAGATANTTIDTSKDASFDLTIGESGWDLATTSQGGTAYSTTGLATFDGASHADLAYIEITSFGNGFGMVFDNIQVEGTLVPEPSSLALLGLGSLSMLRRRRMGRA